LLHVLSRSLARLGNDQWLFDVSARQWTKSGTYVCDRNATTCTDSQSLSSFLAVLPTVLNGSAPHVDLTVSLRRAQVYSTMSQLVRAWSAFNTSSLPIDDPAACTTTCASYHAVLLPGETFSPTPIEGVRSATIGTTRYFFGGYSCTANGVQQQGGDACYHSSMWLLDLLTMRWSSIDPPAANSPTAAYWPSRRAFHVMIAEPTSGIIYVQGGAYQDAAAVFYYYNDCFAFDTQLQTFVPLRVGGDKPPIMWSASAALHGSDVLLHGGCAGGSFYSNVYALKLGVLIGAENCEASGVGLRTAIAGSASTFTIQTRERLSSDTNETAFGSVIAYGTGLPITCQLVQLSTGSRDVTLVQGVVTEEGGGRYTITYTASFGTTYRVYVYVERVEIPGSPFTLTLAPQPSANAPRTTAAGNGVTQTAKGNTAVSRIQISDNFGNAFSNASHYEQLPNGTFVDAAGLYSALTLTATIGPTVSTQLPVSGGFTNEGNGSFLLTYSVPSDDTYVLAIQLNGQPIGGSPFTVEALDPIRLPRATVIAFLVLAAFNIAMCLSANVFIHVSRKRTMMRASSPTFLQVLVVGSILSSLSVVFLVLEGHDYACQSYHSLLSIGVVVMMASLLAKAYRVAKIFNARALVVSKNLNDAHLMVPTFAAVAVILFINMLWIGLDPVKSQARPTSNYPDVLTFQACGSEHGLSFMIAIYIYTGLVLIYGVYLAVQTSHVPDKFNESRVIAAAVYNIFFCAAIIVPLVRPDTSQ
jgi:hypothetical protein